MKRLKQVTAFVLAFLMVVSTFATTGTSVAYASETPSAQSEETQVESVVCEPISFTERTKGYEVVSGSGAEGRYYHYSWLSKLQYTITMKNGDVVEGSNSFFEYNGQQLYITYQDDQSTNHWMAGNTYYPTITVMGYTAQVSVTITETPVQSVVFEPVSLLEGSNGYISGAGTAEEYFCYNWTNRLVFTITMKDGAVISSNGTSFEYNGEWQHLDAQDQQWSEHWTVGNTYYATVEVMGYVTQVPVTITESPVQSVQVEPITLIENSGGYYTSSGPDGSDQFYYYYWLSQLKYTITMKDGAVISSNGTSFEYNGEWKHLDYRDQQWSEHWTVGNTYRPTINVMGCTQEVSVSIVESPVESIEVQPIALAEGKDGHFSSYYGPNGEEMYFNYAWQDRLQYKITMKDGTILEGTDSYEPIVYQNQRYRLECSGDNQFSEHWYANGTYYLTISFLGKSVEVPVTISAITEAEGFEYLVQNGNAIIYGSNKTDKVLNIPSTIDGHTVVGITNLSGAMEYAEEIVIPDSVSMLSDSMFYTNYTLTKLTLGKNISNINNDMFLGTDALKEIVVSKDNQKYVSVDGVVYDKAMTMIVAFPVAKTGKYTVPDTVTDISVLIENIRWYDIELDLGNSKTDYKVVDGILYNADMTVVYACIAKKTGKYDMPDTVTTIQEGAFQNSSFSEIVVSKNVSEIAYAAFSYSVELEKVVLPEKLETISGSAFYACESLKTADLPSGLQVLDTGAFGETAVTTATIPASVTEIGAFAYKDSKLESLVIAEGIQCIWMEAFKGTQLKNVILPNSLQHMSVGAFEDTPLESVVIGTGLEAISSYAFAGTKLKSVTIPENISEIQYFAFANSTLEEVDIKRSDVYFWNGAFYKCPLKEINFKDGTVAISDYAFYGIDADSVVIPDSVTNITYYSFADSKKLLTIEVPDNLNSLDGTAFDGTAWWDAQPDGVVYLNNYLYGYKGKMPEDTVITVKDDTTLIASYALDEEVNLKKLTIPASLKGIGYGALNACLSLEQITVAENNKYYSTNADGTVLYDQYDNAVWKKIVTVTDVDGLIDTFEYGEEFTTEYTITSGEDEKDYTTKVHKNCVSIMVNYVDGTNGWAQLQLKDDMVSGFDSTKPGKQTVALKLGKFDYQYEVTIGEAPHCTHDNATKHAREEADHNKEGNIEYWTCDICNRYFSDAECRNEITQEDTVIAKVAHNHSEGWSKDDSNHWHECECGDKADVNNHTYVEVVADQYFKSNANCVAAKTYYKSCEACGLASKTETFTVGNINADNHVNTELRDVKQTSCKEAGYTGDVYCTDCEKVTVQGEVIPKVVHNAGKWILNSLGWWYQYNDGCYPVNEWAEIGGQKYWFDASGYMETGWLLQGENWYYLNNSGHIHTGWLQSGSTWYYMNPETGIMETGWVTIGESKYYMENSGVMRKGWLLQEGKWYYLEQSGRLAIGWTTIGNSRYYMNENGVMQTGWLTIDTGKYYLSNSGAMQTGWLLQDGEWYYFEANGKLAIGWVIIGASWYYMNEFGVMQTGWLTLNNNKYYLQKSGAMTVNWLNLDGTWYYFSGSGAMETGWTLINGTWYYMNPETGAMQIGWLNLDGTWYYFSGSGAMVTGWLLLGNTWYYMHNGGAMATGWTLIGGKWYNFSVSGAWIS